MPASDFDRDELRDEKRGSAERRPDAPPSQELDWASTLGNSAVQRIARSATGRRTPVGAGMMSLATGVLARQADEEEKEAEGGAAATATAEPAPEAEPAMPEAAAETEVAEEELEEEETGWDDRQEGRAPAGPVAARAAGRRCARRNSATLERTRRARRSPNTS